METSKWYDNNTADSSLSIKPFLKAIPPGLIHPFTLEHHYIDSSDALYRYVKHPGFGSTPLIFIAQQGTQGGIMFNKEDGLGLDDLTFAFQSETDVKRVIYLGAFSVFGGENGDLLAQSLLSDSRCEAVIGYTQQANWFEGLFTDLLFIQRFYCNLDPLSVLQEIYDSVLNDFAPARRIGLKMYPGTSNI